MNVPSLCTKIIKITFGLLFILVPLILTPINYELFEYNKMMVTYALAVIIIGTWIVKMASEKRITITKTPLDLPIGLFFVSQLVSALFSMDPHVSWFGFYSRFNGGMWSVITYTLLFYAFVSNISLENTALRKLIRTSLGVAVVIALYGFAERLGIDKNLWVQDVQSRVFSTLGQPNWLAAYLIALTPFFWMFLVENAQSLSPTITPRGRKGIQTYIVTHSKILARSFRTIVPFAGSLLFFIVLLFTRSRTGLFAFAVMDILFWGSVLWKTKPVVSVIAPISLIHIGMALIVFVNGSYIKEIDRFVTLNGWKNALSKSQTASTQTAQPSGTLLEYGGTGSGTIRKYVWQGAINAWKSSPKTMLIGTGTETFAWAFFKFRPVEHNMVSEWDFLYNKAHNEYLNYLATTGLFGLASYLFLIGAIGFTTMKTYHLVFFGKNTKFSILTLALFTGWISILITNFFGFSVVIVQLLFFLLPAMIVIANSKSEDTKNQRAFQLPSRLSEPVRIIAILTASYVLVRIGISWYADTQFAAGYRLNRSNMPAQAQPYLEHAVSLSPNEPLYHDELSSALAGLTVLVLDGKNASEAAKLAKASINENTKAISISPENVNFWKTRTKIFYSFSTFDPQFNKMAIESLTKALNLSPNDPKILYNLAILYSRENDSDRAIELLKKAKEIKANYRDAYYALSVFYTELKRPAEAKAELMEYLTKVDPTDKDFLERTK
jgi:putative inorganic carbon (hco3(-)) transporter